MKQYIMLLFCLIISLTATAVEGEKTKAQEAYEQAENARKAGKPLRAIELYTRAIKLDPKYFDAYNNRSAVFSALGRLDEALSDCSKVIELNPDYMPAYANRGRIFQSKNQHDKAVEDFKKAIELDPKYNINYISLAVSQLALKDYAGAIETYTKAIEINTDNKPKESIVFRVERSRLYMLNKEYDKALEDVEAIIKTSPNSAEAFNLRGVIFKEKGMNNEALADYSKAIELDPKNLAAYVNRTTLYKELGEYEKSLADCRKVIELAPKAEEYKKMAEELEALIREGKNINK